MRQHNGLGGLRSIVPDEGGGSRDSLRATVGRLGRSKLFDLSSRRFDGPGWSSLLEREARVPNAGADGCANADSDAGADTNSDSVANSDTDAGSDARANSALHWGVDGVGRLR
jgi:hypothetical protein